MKLRIAVIFGGRSGEHEVSLVSATSIINALNPRKYEVFPVGITKNGLWLTGKNVLQKFKAQDFSGLQSVTLHPHETKWDVAFPVLHGPYGEDGTIQGLFDMLGIPYVGCNTLASSTCMDKLMTKIIFQSFGLPQAKFFHATRHDIQKNFAMVKKNILQKIGLPCFVKPSNMGSSVGISKVKKMEDLKRALEEAAHYDSSVLTEAAVNAREIECAVLGNENPAASVAGEIVPSREFYDYYAKYVDGKSGLYIPAKISPKKMKEVQTLALRAYRALQCSGLARVDFLMDKKTGKLFLNEINTMPGFTAISMYPKLWEASGIHYQKLLDRLITLALERARERAKNKISFDSGSHWYAKP